LFQAGDYAAADTLIARIEKVVTSGVVVEGKALAEFHRLRGARARHIGDVAGDAAGYLAALLSCPPGDEREACNARVSVGFAYIELGDYAAARGELERALTAAERMGLSTIASRARQNLALVHAAEGQLTTARSMLLAVIAESQEHGNLRFEGWTRIYLSRVEHQRGDHAAAEREALAAVALTEVTPPARAGALAALARARLGLGEMTEARRAARKALSILDNYGGIEEFEALVRLAHAETLLASGLRLEAREALCRARERLLALASRLDDPEQRRRFLSQVPENLRLMQLVSRILDETTLPSRGDPAVVRLAEPPPSEVEKPRK
jgi:ATP/maltotriose-dependent transcriptional regulator MalT